MLDQRDTPHDPEAIVIETARERLDRYNGHDEYGDVFCQPGFPYQEIWTRRQSRLRKAVRFIMHRAKYAKPRQRRQFFTERHASIGRKATVGLAVGGLLLFSSLTPTQESTFEPSIQPGLTELHNARGEVAESTQQVSAATPARAVLTHAEPNKAKPIYSFIIDEGTPTIWQGVSETLETNTGVKPDDAEVATQIRRISDLYEANPDLVHSGDQVFFQAT